MLVELHLIQNFAPANLNRDDTNSPKECEFGGRRRARISSQCQKRAIRLALGDTGGLDADALGTRTRLLRNAVRDRLADRGMEPERAEAVANAGVEATRLKFADAKQPAETQYLVFLANRDIERLTELCAEHAETLAAPAARGRKEGLPKEVAKAFEGVFAGRSAVDVGLFGRMLADLPKENVDAASQVAHAISTHALDAEFDFYTAVDDLKTREEDAGAGMLGTIEFNSSCFYRYLNLDLDQLTANLGGDADTARAGLAAFLLSAVTALPTGKQNSFAAHNLPSLVLAVVRDDAPRQLANAFVRPVAPRRDDDLVGASIGALSDYWGRLNAMYGDDGLRAAPVLADPAYDGQLGGLAAHTVPNLRALCDAVLAAIAATEAGR